MLPKSVQFALLTASVSFCVAASAMAQTPTTVSGKDLFDNYCAVCHGPAGRGDGPLATELKTPPADLRMIAKKNNGTFPSEQVYKLIDGKDPAIRNPRSHGGSTMPVWGDVFTKVRDYVPVKEKVDALVRYIERLQQK
ncbi:MAG: cytochrome c [Vicinamibacterales bacterium]